VVMICYVAHAQRYLRRLTSSQKSSAEKGVATEIKLDFAVRGNEPFASFLVDRVRNIDVRISLNRALEGLFRSPNLLSADITDIKVRQVGQFKCKINTDINVRRLVFALPIECVLLN